jgi:hypothetical protein
MSRITEITVCHIKIKMIEPTCIQFILKILQDTRCHKFGQHEINIMSTNISIYFGKKNM